MSYSVGVAFGRSLKQQGQQEVNLEAVVRGVKDAFTNQKLAISEDEQRTTYQSFQRDMTNKIGKARDLLAWDNKQASDAFLAENAAKDGIVALPSGLQYKVITAGAGALPTDEDVVTCHYRGTLINGTEIDSTYAREKPASFPLKGAIPGWRQALKLMPAGSKWQVFVPPQLAYSKQGAGRLIGPNAALIFEIELISVDKS